MINLILILIIIFIAAVFDVKSREIPDWLTVPFILLGVGITYFQQGLVYLIMLLLTGFIISEILFILKTFGGGDLKLFLGLTLVGGLKFGFYTIYFSFFSFIPIFIFYILKERKFKVNVPYAAAIFGGAIIAVIKGGGLYV